MFLAAFGGSKREVIRGEKILDFLEEIQYFLSPKSPFRGGYSRRAKRIETFYTQYLVV